MKDSSAYFVIRNSVHVPIIVSNDGNDDNDDYISSSSEDDEIDEGVAPTVAIVHLVEAPRGMYMLDLADESYMNMVNLIVDNEISYSDDDQYVDIRTWNQLKDYSALVGKPITKEDGQHQHEIRLETATNAHRGAFILLDDGIKEVIHTLLSIDSLFSWSTLVEARDRGTLRWKDIRYYLSHVRNNTPYLTHDGLLKHVVNSHVTFHQFVAFASLIDKHLVHMSQTQIITAFPDDIDISDIFPSFESLTTEGQRIELLASIKDKAVRTSAQTSNLVIPTSADELVSISECNSDWRLYINWWISSDGLRNKFCMRELLFAEGDNEVRRNAEKNGISLRGRHSKDPFLREQYLRRFGCWYYISGDNDDEDESSADANEEKAHPTTIQTYDFAAVSSSSPAKMTHFQNKAWKPSVGAASVAKQTNDQNDADILPPLFVTTSSLADTAKQPKDTVSTSIRETVSTVTNIVPSRFQTEESLQASEHEEERVLSTITSSVKNDNINATNDNRPIEDDTFIVCSKIKPTQKKKPPVPSFRHRFLRRVTSTIDDVTSMVNKKSNESTRLKGIALFRSKVRLLIMLKRFLNIDMSMIESVAPENVDIFSIKVNTPPEPPKIPDPPKQIKPDGRLAKELVERAKAHHNVSLSRKVFDTMARWAYKMKLERQRKEQQGLLDQQRIQVLIEKATVVYNRTMLSRSFCALRDHAEMQKNERAKAIPPGPVPEPVVVEEFSFVARPPSVERKYMAMEDERSNKFRSMRSLSLLSSEVDNMDLIVGRNRKSSLDVLDQMEYNEQFAHGIELTTRPSPRSPQEECGLLDDDTLQQMRREKLAGASNLYDVPEEFVCSPSIADGDGYNYVQYRAKELSRGLANHQDAWTDS